MQNLPDGCDYYTYWEKPYEEELAFEKFSCACSEKDEFSIANTDYWSDMFLMLDEDDKAEFAEMIKQVPFDGEKFLIWCERRMLPLIEQAVEDAWLLKNNY